MYCHDRIVGYKCPQGIAFAEALPQSGAGTILKRELREPYWVAAERRVH